MGLRGLKFLSPIALAAWATIGLVGSTWPRSAHASRDEGTANAAGDVAVTYSKSPSFFLAKGRLALESGDLEKAHGFFSNIPFSHSLWKEKVEDLVRYHLLHGSAEEAWRLIQVLRRVGEESSVLNDYERLAVFRAKACPLALTEGAKGSAHLLNAATYRLLLSRKSDSYSDSGADSAASYLAPGLVPYLADIPKTTLIKGAGCRVEKLAHRSKEDLLRSEANALMAFDTSGFEQGTPSLEARLVIFNRMALIARELKNSSLGASVTRRLQELAPSFVWEKIPDGDRRWVFRQLFAEGKISDVQLERRTGASAIALRVIESEPSVAAADWLAMLDLESLPAAKRVAIFSRIEALGAFQGRAWLLVQLAWARAERGETREALTVLRRLLLESEERLDDELEASAVALAGAVFSEHRFDERLQGAIQSSLPSRMWRSLLEDLQIRIALKGSRIEYSKISALLRKQRDTGFMRPVMNDLLRELAVRDLGAFRRRLGSSAAGGPSDRDLIALASKIAARYPELSESERSSVQPFSSDLAQALRKRIKSWDTRWDRLGDVVHILDQAGSEWKIGSQAVRQGTVQMGVARWQRPEMSKSPFVLKAPENLPLHTLIYVPNSIGGRGWALAIDLP